MAFFLKKSTLKGRTYLSIVESYYSPQKHGGAHRTYKSLASVETWKAKGIDDPVAYFQKEVDELNKNNKNKDSLKISDRSPELYLGYFPFVSMMKKMDIKKYVDYFNLHNSFEFDLYELLSSLIYARLVNPCSKQFAGYNMLVTSEKDMDDIDIYNTYHNLWRIEESFRIMKSDLDARPVFLQKENSIKGHFLICYLAVLLERILQFKILNNQYSTHQIMKFIRNFKVVKGESKYINVTTSSEFIKEFEKITDLPLTNYYLTERQIRQIFNYKI